MKQVDVTNENPEYWNKVLSEESLSVDKGRSRKLIYAGGSSDLDLIQQHSKEVTSERLEN